MQSKTAGALGLCRRAGRLVQGYDAVCRSVQSGEAKLVIVAADVSEKTEKEVRFVAEKAQIPLLRIGDDMSALSEQLGRKVGVLSVTDSELANAVRTTTGEFWKGGHQE